jgi:hypothetical protein
MYNESLFPIWALIATTLWLAIRHVIAVAQTERQAEIAKRGAPCQGRVVAIQRPFMLDVCTRFYVDFVPEGCDRPMRACHVDRRSPEEMRGALPVAGSIVPVLYLPDRPKHAVISKLVTPTGSRRDYADGTAKCAAPPAATLKERLHAPRRE